MSVARRARVAAVLAVVLLTAVLGCGGEPKVDYAAARDAGALVVYVGAGEDREILRYVAEELLPDSVRLELADAPGDANARVSSGAADLAYFQHIPAFEADRRQHGYDDLSVVAAATVVPYGLYSARWRSVAETQSWVNAGLVADDIAGDSLPHGSRVALPATPTGFARGLYLLQSAGLVLLDRPFGGTTAPDLTITQANVRDSLRHLTLLGLSYDEYLDAIYRGYDAVVLNPEQARSLGLEPARDALALEPGPRNPYAHVLVAPARLAGDQRVLELTHALESPELGQFLATTYRGANIPVAR
ncbi:MetQ/NlpA family ABC transporter substrate-binding protein [Nocardia sp. NPDC050697]|uniref:MetQ/NlpA family ABC transporter substrate-binding protein n=1 Tax=Nocardia sp. NPDC050697 TaxID=3155158 RepID=UPI0033E68659